MDTKTKKAQKKVLKTPKQVIAKIGSLLKGIDNSVVGIDKHKATLNASIKEVRNLMGGLGNAPAPAKKPEKKSPPPAKKPEKKSPPVKKSPPAKKPAPPAKKPEKKPAPAKAAAKVGAKEKKVPVAGRPSLKEAARQIIAANAGPMTAAEIWNQATAKWGHWSRQSLYVALKDEKSFKRQGEKFSLPVSVNDAEAESFISKIESSQAVASVQ